MTHRLTIENFYSIREAQILDLALPRTTPGMARFPPSRACADTRLPTVVAFFGPNASGKTTILRALSAVLNFIFFSFHLAPDAAVPFFQPFKSPGWWNQPSRVMVEFDAAWLDGDDRVFCYDLLVAHCPRPGTGIGHEILSVRDGRRFRTVFRRDEAGIRCTPALGLPPGVSLPRRRGRGRKVHYAALAMCS